MSTNSDKIKQLREKTGAGMLDCRDALTENNGDIEASIIWLRKKGVASASKKSSRVASDGLIGTINNTKLCCLCEINTETDFVSKNQEFQTFFQKILEKAIETKINVAELLKLEYSQGSSIEEALKDLIAKIGENIVIRRLSYLELENENQLFGKYLHNKITDNLGKIGCFVKAECSKEKVQASEILKKIAMHISASRPQGLDTEDISSVLLEKEKDIFREQLRNEGKSEDIIENIIKGKINKFLTETTLLNQKWIMDTTLSVKEVIKNFNNEYNSDLQIKNFNLFVLGEGVEVVEKNFAEEVASQMNDSS